MKCMNGMKITVVVFLCFWKWWQVTETDMKAKHIYNVKTAIVFAKHIFFFSRKIEHYFFQCFFYFFCFSLQPRRTNLLCNNCCLQSFYFFFIFLQRNIFVCLLLSNAFQIIRIILSAYVYVLNKKRKFHKKILLNKCKVKAI